MWTLNVQCSLACALELMLWIAVFVRVYVHCRVSTFMLATEDPTQSLRIVAATSDLRTPAYYDKGVSE